MSNFGFEDVMSGMRTFHDAMHEARVHPPWQSANKEAQQRWNPYSFEGGYALTSSVSNAPVEWENAVRMNEYTGTESGQLGILASAVSGSERKGQNVSPKNGESRVCTKPYPCDSSCVTSVHWKRVALALSLGVVWPLRMHGSTA